MLIYCPKCNTCYNLNEDLIPESGRKLRCSNCKEIFHFDKTGASESVVSEAERSREAFNESDSVEKQHVEEKKYSDVNFQDGVEEDSDKGEPEAEINMQDIFERLNEQSEKLFQEEQKMPKKERLLLQIKTMLGLNRKFNFRIIGMVGALVLVLLAYNYRYEVVRAVPFTNVIYKMFGIRAKIPGEGLEFQNVNWNYVDNDGRKILEVKGFINNPTKKEIDIPVVHVELLDKDSQLLQSINQKPSIKTLKPETRVAIGVVVKTPSPTAKYVYMTFIEID
ncbi:MAG: zinc-ribbon domain-containing protein [Alphaproteobacteria bacterium]|nr:zinc-ribbon domain-containing protein [Alphaproteobacteria bacterium]